MFMYACDHILLLPKIFLVVQIDFVHSLRHICYAELLCGLFISSFSNYDAKNINAHWYSGNKSIFKGILY